MSMSISAARNAPAAKAEVREGPGPDRTPDGDADDRAPVRAQAAAPAGQGRLVNRSA